MRWLLLVVPLASISCDADEPLRVEPAIAIATRTVATRAASPQAIVGEEPLTAPWEPEAYLEPTESEGDDPFGSCGGCGCWSP